jgi:hypothetical protein
MDQRIMCTCYLEHLVLIKHKVHMKRYSKEQKEKVLSKKTGGSVSETLEVSRLKREIEQL